MTANTDVMHNTRKGSLWEAARDYPLLVAISAFLLFAATLFGSTFLGTVEHVKTVVEVMRLDLDRDANNPNTLIRIAPPSIDVEREAILSDRLIDEAIEKARNGPATTPDGMNAESPALTNAVLANLEIQAGAEAGELELSLSPDAVGPSDRVADTVNAIASSYVDLRNRERKLQKEQALSWADEKLAYWQGTIDILRSSKAGAFDTLTPTGTLRTESKRLLGFFLDATKSAQAATLSRIQKAIGTASDQQPEAFINGLESAYANLLQDQKKLERVSLGVDQVSDKDQAEPSNLRDAEEELALFKSNLEGLISSGVLDTPAAKIVIPASIPSWRPMFQWNVVIPAAAALSIMIALGLAFFTSRWRATNDQYRMTGPETDVLSDPNWPMPPRQRREELAGRPNH